MLSVKILSNLLAPLSRERRIMIALKLLGITQAEAARRIEASHVTVRMALSKQGASDKTRILEKLDRLVEDGVAKRGGG